MTQEQTQVQTQEQTRNLRRALRDNMLMPGASCFTTTPSGKLIEGVVRDISDTGAGIAIDTEGLQTGQQLSIVFVITAGKKVRFEGFIKHVEPGRRHCGIQFTAGPENLEPSFDPRVSAAAKDADALAPDCIRCQSHMETGYIIDHAHVGRGRERVCSPQWTKGVGAVVGKGVAIDSGETDRTANALRVISYRCPDCGLLESYAQTAKS